jgi:guanyl-specific ribonuclease Sa
MTGDDWNKYFQEQYGKDNVYWSSSNHSVSIGELSPGAQQAYQGYSNNGWKGNYSGQEGNAIGKSKAGGTWGNDYNQLPTHDASGKVITYKEFDISPPGFDGRDSYRFVTGSDGNVYYTPDHYTTFYKVR